MSLLQSILEEIRSARQRMKDQGQKALGQAFSDFFDACPEIQGIVWTQFAPHFNDGGPCEFDINEVVLVPYPNKVARDLAEKMELDPDAEETDLDQVCVWEPMTCYHRPENDQELRIRAEFQQHLKDAFGEKELFKLVFDDDCKVIATREGFEICEFEHD